MANEGIIFNYDYFYETVVPDIEKYIGDQNDVNKKSEFYSLLRNSGIDKSLLKNMNKTTADLILGKCIGIDEKNLWKYLTSEKKNSRPLYDDKVEGFYRYFNNNLPMFLNSTQFLKSMLLSSNLLFKSSNLKLCFAVMVDRFKINQGWTEDEILEECKNYVDTEMLSSDKIKKTLETHCLGNQYIFSLDDTSSMSQNINYAFFRKTENGKYILNLTELIAYYNYFLNNLNK